VSLLSPSFVRVLAEDGRLADAAAVSPTQIQMHMTVYCRLNLSNIHIRLPRYLPAPSLLSDLRRIAAPCLLGMDFDAHDGEFCPVL
jgi:hypothetical protein